MQIDWLNIFGLIFTQGDHTIFFGDVIFDKTYSTNKYRTIFALFGGVNHHGHLIIT